jgi:hypothetical protein
MRKATPIFSAFTIVSIESIWPSFDGDEVPINYQDLTLLNERIGEGTDSFRSQQANLASEKDSKEEELRALEGNTALPPTIVGFSRKEITTSDSKSFEYTATTLVIEGREFTQKIATIELTYKTNKDIFEKYIKRKTDTNTDTNAEIESNPDSFTFNGNESNKEAFEKAFKELEAVFNGIPDNVNELVSEISSIEKELLDQSAYGTYPQAMRRPSFSSILSSEDAYKKRRGYFKLIPLNIVQASTSTSTSGMVGQSSFNVSFTMDDVLVVADEFGANQISGSLPRAVPIKINEVFDEIDRRSFGNTVSQAVREDLNKFGLYAFRISGDDFTFNIEDIVEANDTVTVWMYHDPKEFDFVDNTEVNGSNQLDRYVLNKDFSYVIGSGSRKSQDDFKLLNDDGSIFKKPPRTLVQTIFFETGILNGFSTPEQLAELGEDAPSVSLTNLDVFNFLVAAGQRADLGGLGLDATRAGVDRLINREGEGTRRVLDSVSSSLTIDDTRLISNRVSSILKDIFLPDIPRANGSINSAKIGLDDPGLNNIPETARSYNSLSLDLRNSIKDILLDSENDNKTAEDLADIWEGSGAKKRTIRNYELSQFVTTSEMEDIFQNIISYKPTASSLANESLEVLRDKNTNKLIEPSTEINGFFNKRTYLKNQSHGETPYLAVKGHISSVEVKYGAGQGSHIISITGSGYEKVLNDNIVYYEDLFSPTGGAFAQAVEAYPIYSQMLPPKGMLSFIETTAPRFILIGKPTKQTIDARNMSLRFARKTNSKADNVTEDRPVGSGIDDRDASLGLQPQPKQKDVFNVVEKYFPSEQRQGLVRGLAAIDINVVAKERTDTFKPDDNIGLRIFYPVNYLNTSRIREMIKSLESAYEQNPEEAVIKIPIKISPMQSIANNLQAFNGPKEVNHLFVDETGRLRQRLAYEAWERPPMPEYMPTITDSEVLVSGSSFSRDSGPVITMVDIRANYLTTAQGIVDARFAGRTLSGGNDYIPLMVIKNEQFNNSRLLGEDSNFYEVISEPFFRYGMKYKLLNDVYTSSTRVAKRKSILYQGFFSKPLKTAKIALRNNTSYRAGETVLVCLDSYRYRSREIIDVIKTLNWLNYLKNERPDLVPLYIGVDKRWLNHESYYNTVSLDNSREYGFWLSKFKENPEEYILDRFIDTFEYLSRKLRGGLKFITPEYFPTTYWADSDLNSTGVSIGKFYDEIFNRLVGSEIDDRDASLGLQPQPRQFELNYDDYKYIRMQNFKVTSYYIESVQHSYTHGEGATTSLSLNHGQDNLVLLEPFSMKPIGFMSTERKMRIGFDDVVTNDAGNIVFEDEPNKNTKDRLLWEDYPNKMSDLQVMYIEQAKQDKEFKNNSFLYTAQKYRNSSNFMYELALDLGLVN